MAGRPTIYTEELGIDICDWISTNSAGLKVACKNIDHFPDYETIRRWLRDNKFPEFSARYARAHEEQSETMGEDIIIIADNASLNPHDKRVRIDARKWLMGKLKPKKYGEKLDLTTNGEKIGESVITTIIDGKIIDGKAK